VRSVHADELAAFEEAYQDMKERLAKHPKLATVATNTDNEAVA
jgi:hypothetical protein